MSTNVNRIPSIGVNLYTGIFTLNNEEVTGWAQDSESYGTEKITLFDEYVGPDGSLQLLPRGDKGERIILKLKHTSPTVPFLNENMSNNLAGLFIPLTAKFFDPRSGDSHNLGTGYLVAAHKYHSMGVENQGILEYDLRFSNTSSTINNPSVNAVSGLI